MTDLVAAVVTVVEILEFVNSFFSTGAFEAVVVNVTADNGQPAATPWMATVAKMMA